mmetsp:Transcript_42730/g.106345  ORF Transcript_42730/g.106345 Transcript_42730/m.106345 type:complete len:450 (+) Transcript_42730:39-1388(+)|eukprot:CAMPEP_0195611986 /NCGR_PEP_ID=MMETSP0815-20121206/10628_1 /TAXON_ID=97485 /ORGANISM="Prymnesium parvum, Strain Texoma1" /LENGTH=449 /DNA_ID=CAMNT_0040752065 /DNA_START=21 /DNA_END=1370 /DNA_ORIENTATION=+
MSHYSFPILPNKEIVHLLNEISIEVVDDDLLNPTSGKVQLLYQQLVELLLNQRREDMLQPQFAGMAELEFPELHDESVSTMAFLRACQRLLTTCGISDFTLQDLIKPEHKRLRRNMSAVLNFCKFREDQLTKYMEFRQETDALANKKLHLEQENERLLTELKDVTRERQQEAPEEQALKSENEEREVVMRELWKRKTAMEQENKLLKAQLQEVKDEIHSTEFHLQEAKKECNYLSMQIVDDPTKLKAELQGLQEMEKHEKGTIKQLEAKVFPLAKQVEAVVNADAHVDEVLQLQMECETQSAKLKENNKELATLAERELSDKAESSAQAHNIRSAAQREQRMKERIDRLKQEHLSKQKKAKESLAETTLQWKQLESERSVQSRQLEENDSVLRDLKDAILKAKMAHNDETTRIIQQQQHLANQVRAYHKNLMAAMKVVSGQTAQQVNVS